MHGGIVKVVCMVFKSPPFVLNCLSRLADNKHVLEKAITMAQTLPGRKISTGAQLPTYLTSFEKLTR